VNHTKAVANVMKKSALKSTIKKCKSAIEGGAGAETQAVLSRTFSAIDKAAARKLIHKNTAARKKSKLAKALNKAAAI